MPGDPVIHADPAIHADLASADSVSPGARPNPGTRRPQDRLDDHAAIGRLTDGLLPALVAKLGASGLGELEVREGTWRVRLRMPADGRAVADRRSSGRPGTRPTDRPHGDQSRPEAAGGAGTRHGTIAPGQAPEGTPPVGPSRLVATSPAVGYFRPRADLRAGTRVRAGDRVGSVDVLGIRQDVVAPADGLIGATLVEAGEPVEYGQAIIVLEQLADERFRAAGAAATPPTGDGESVSDGAAALEGVPAADVAPVAESAPAAESSPTAERGSAQAEPSGAPIAPAAPSAPDDVPSGAEPAQPPYAQGLPTAASSVPDSTEAASPELAAGPPPTEAG